VISARRCADNAHLTPTHKYIAVRFRPPVGETVIYPELKELRQVRRNEAQCASIAGRGPLAFADYELR